MHRLQMTPERSRFMSACVCVCVYHCFTLFICFTVSLCLSHLCMHTCCNWVTLAPISKSEVTIFQARGEELREVPEEYKSMSPVFTSSLACIPLALAAATLRSECECSCMCRRSGQAAGRCTASSCSSNVSSPAQVGSSSCQDITDTRDGSAGSPLEFERNATSCRTEEQHPGHLV